MTTIYDILIDAKDRVLDAHPFFTKGYAFARQHAEMGIAGSIGKEMSYVGITDQKGDYFYIRIPDKITSVPYKANSDANVAIKESIRCALVAVVKDANEFALKDSLINVLLKTRVIAVRDQYIDRFVIAEAEFKGLDEKVIKRAIGNLKDKTLVRIDFDIERIFNTNTCEYDICNTCVLNEQ